MIAKQADTRRVVNRTVLVILVLIFSWSSHADNAATNKSSIEPAIESVSDTVAFIRWTVPNPGGTILRFAVVQYGTDPNHLDLTAKSPTRINPGHNEMIFRARVGNLEPGTTYYYRAYSTQAGGIYDSQPSAIGRFTTRQTEATVLSH